MEIKGKSRDSELKEAEKENLKSRSAKKLQEIIKNARWWNKGINRDRSRQKF